MYITPLSRVVFSARVELTTYPHIAGCVVKEGESMMLYGWERVFYVLVLVGTIFAFIFTNREPEERERADQNDKALMAEIARFEQFKVVSTAPFDVLNTLEEWQAEANGTDGFCHCRAEYISRLYNDNVVLALCCALGPTHSPLDPLVVQPTTSRFSPDDLLPQGAMEQGGIMPMLNFMKGAQTPQVEVPPRPPTAAELRRFKGSVVVP